MPANCFPPTVHEFIYLPRVFPSSADHRRFLGGSPTLSRGDDLFEFLSRRGGKFSSRGCRSIARYFTRDEFNDCVSLGDLAHGTAKYKGTASIVGTHSIQMRTRVRFFFRLFSQINRTQRVKQFLFRVYELYGMWQCGENQDICSISLIPVRVGRLGWRLIF